MITNVGTAFGVADRAPHARRIRPVPIEHDSSAANPSHGSAYLGWCSRGGSC